MHFGQLCHILATADRLHEAGDLEGARAALHRPAIWHLSEEQSIARLAAFHLDLHAATGRHAYATALACSRLVGADPALGHRRNLPVQRPWGVAELQAVRERAAAWLADPAN